MLLFVGTRMTPSVAKEGRVRIAIFRLFFLGMIVLVVVAVAIGSVRPRRRRILVAVTVLWLMMMLLLLAQRGVPRRVLFRGGTSGGGGGGGATVAGMVERVKLFHQFVELLPLGLFGQPVRFFRQLVFVGVSDVGRDLGELGPDCVQRGFLGRRVRTHRRLAFELGIDQVKIHAALLQDFFPRHRRTEQIALAAQAALTRSRRFTGSSSSTTTRAGFQLATRRQGQRF
jgi:hypothetical protein